MARTQQLPLAKIRSVQWQAVADDAGPLAAEPESGLWQRLKLGLRCSSPRTC